MAQIFPKWTNKLPLYVLIGVLFFGANAVGFVWYYGSPKYTDVGYRPKQPVDYSHKLHAGDLGLDCRYCHTGVEISPVAMVPPTSTCMNCHTTVLTESEKLAPIRESLATGIPIEWERVHKTPDFAYFDHSVHTKAGVGCKSCHGNVDQMEVVQQVEPLSMSWCLDCHRAPEMHLRTDGDVTNMDWEPAENQLELAAQFIKEKNIDPPRDCSGCHR